VCFEVEVGAACFSEAAGEQFCAVGGLPEEFALWGAFFADLFADEGDVDAESGVDLGQLCGLSPAEGGVSDVEGVAEFLGGASSDE